MLGSTAYVVADCDRADAMTLNSCLLSLQLPMIASWEGPLPSPASRPGAARATFRGHLRRGVADGLLPVAVHAVAISSLPSSVVVGSSALYGDGTAMIAELAAATAVARIRSNIEEGIFLSPTQFLSHPAGTKKDWENLVTDLAITDAAESVVEVRWRRSTNSGRPWVRPQLLMQDHRVAVQRARARAAGRPEVSDDVAATVLIALRGPSLGQSPAALLLLLVARFGDKLGYKLNEATAGRALARRQWMKEMGEYGEWAGRVRVRVDGRDDVRKLYDAFHDTPVWLGSSWSVLSVQNPLLPAVAGGRQHSGNDRGRRAGRSA